MRLALALLLVSPSPALCGEIGRALEPLPVLRPVAIAALPAIPAAAIPGAAIPPLLPALSVEKPVETVVPKGVEVPTLDQRLSAHEPTAPVPAAPEREHHHGLFGHQ